MAMKPCEHRTLITLDGGMVPDEGSEALRDLVRAREAAKQDQMRAWHRLTKPNSQDMPSLAALVPVDLPNGMEGLAKMKQIRPDPSYLPALSTSTVPCYGSDNTACSASSCLCNSGIGTLRTGR
jgi:hypothetical protein